MRSHTALALHILFTLFYGTELDFTHFETFNPGFSIVDIVSTVCAYAEYFLCHPQIKLILISSLLAYDSFWENVPRYPKRHVQLAKRLGIQELYYDALRHFVAQVGSGKRRSSGTNRNENKWTDVADAMGESERDVRNFFGPQLALLPDRLVPTLDRRLRRLGIPKSHDARYAGTWEGYEASSPDRDAEHLRRLRMLEYARVAACEVWGWWWAGAGWDGDGVGGESGNKYNGHSQRDVDETHTNTSNMNLKLRFLEQKSSTTISSAAIFAPFITSTYLATAIAIAPNLPPDIQNSLMNTAKSLLNRALSEILKNSQTHDPACSP